MNFGSGDFTAEGWIYPITNPGDGGGIFGGASGSSNPLLIAYNNSTGSWGFGRNFIAWDHSFSQAPILNSWQHLAVSRSGTTLRLFFNGVLKTTATTSQAYSMSGGGTQGFNGTTGYVTGYIAGVLVTNTALYTASFTPSTSPPTAVTGTQLLLNYTNAGVIDGSMQNNIETIGDAKISTAQSKFGGSSMSFDGTGDYLTFPTSPNLQFGTGDFTIELWTYLIARGSLGSSLINNYNAYTAGSLAIFAGHSSASATKYQVAYNGSGFPNIQSATSISFNTWVHIAVVRSGTTITLYINGVADGTLTGASAALNGVGPNWIIGTAGDGIASYNVNGYIDDVRITKGVARYTANFTPPATALSTQ
jgi:hypothetical protein